eukprot:m.716351 g.716351  ORF g.716351 m.716351 type:complete len:132 (+) comp22984_c1_seq16:1680-2075(+)
MPGALQAYLLHLNGVERLIAALPKVSEEEATKLIRKAHHVHVERAEDLKRELQRTNTHEKLVRDRLVQQLRAQTHGLGKDIDKVERNVKLLHNASEACLTKKQKNLEKVSQWLNGGITGTNGWSSDAYVVS